MTRLGDICEKIGSGATPHGGKEAYCLEGISFVRSQNIGDFAFSANGLAHINNEQAKKLSNVELKSNDVLLNITGDSVARACIMDSEYLPARVNQHVAVIRGKKDIVLSSYLLYFLQWKKKHLLQLASAGATRNALTKSMIEQLEIELPTIEQQRKIAGVLDEIQEKIKLNQKINDNLEKQATALFESWFVNYDPWGGIQPSGWTNAPLGTFVEIKRGGSPRPIQDYLSNSGLRWLKISDVTSLRSPFVLEIKEHIKEEGLRKTVFLHAGELVLSNSATPGIPKILDVDTCIHDGWLYFPKSELSKYYLYLFFKHIRKELISLGNGSIFTNLKTDILKAFPATKADKATLKDFDAVVAPLFDAMLNIDQENLKLATMRDMLLPKLMSGKFDVSNIQL